MQYVRKGRSLLALYPYEEEQERDIVTQPYTLPKVQLLDYNELNGAGWQRGIRRIGLAILQYNRCQ